MKARVNRFYWEEVEEIIINITDKVSEIDCITNPTPFHEDKKTALLILISVLDEMKGVV